MNLIQDPDRLVDESTKSMDRASTYIHRMVNQQYVPTGIQALRLAAALTELVDAAKQLDQVSPWGSLETASPDTTTHPP